MRNWNRYVLGGLIGMTAEYLYRVEFYISAFVCLCALILLALIDIFTTKKK